jgi:DNA-binding NarL/FixJ family response regulator
VLRVIVAEDNALLRDGITRILDAQADMTVLGVAGDLPTLLDLVAADPPDVVITDIRMPPTGTDEGIRGAEAIRREHPGVGVVVLSQHTNPSYALGLLGSGSEGRAYLLKERVSDVDQLLHAVREVARKGSVIDPKVVETLVGASSRRTRSALDRLTPREREILQEMAEGKSNAAIAASLVVSERAVEKHSNSIFMKLGLTEEPSVNRRVKAVLAYLADTGAGD